MNILDYALAKQLFGGSGSGEVSGTIDINENGTYNVAKYAHANVNVASSGGGESGVPIEVAELPTPTADCVGKVYHNQADGDYYVGEQSIVGFKVGEPLGNKIYFDTSVNIADYGSAIPAGGMVSALMAYSDTAQFAIILGEMLGGGEQGTCYIVVCGDPSGVPSVAYVQCSALTVDQFNEMIGLQMGISITGFGWQTDVLDTSAVADCLVEQNFLSTYDNCAYKEKGLIFKNLDDDESGTPIEVAELPEATDDAVGKVYLNTTDGNYYVGEKSFVLYEDGEEVSLIYFDKGADIPEIMKGAPVEEAVELFTLTDGYGNTGGLFLTYLKIDLSTMGMEGYLYIIANFDTPPYVYLYCDVLTVEQFNETLASQMGIPPIQAFGWQIEWLDIRPYDNGGYKYILTNQLPNGQPFAYKEYSLTLQKLVKATE